MRTVSTALLKESMTLDVSISNGLDEIQSVQGYTDESKNTKVPTVDLAKQALKSYFNRFSATGIGFAAARYKFVVTKVDNRYDCVTLSFRILHKENKPGTAEVSTPDHHLHEYNQKWRGGMTGAVTYKTPQDAVKNIPADGQLAYRGMSWEEWQSIRKTGKIQSHGTYNLGDEQSGLTMFGYEPSTALSYAHGFAPMEYQTTAKRPGVVIAIPRNITLSHQDDPEGIPQSELAVRGSAPISSIVHVWMLVPTSAKSEGGEMEIRIPWVASWDNKVYKDPKMGVFHLDPTKVSLGSGSMSVVQGYAIRQIF